MQCNSAKGEEKPSMVKIIESKTSTEGYAIDDDGVVTDLTEKMRYVDKRRPDTLYYHLPENSANRHYIAADKLKDGLVLEYKASNPTGPRGSGKTLEDYMTENEKAIATAYAQMIEEVKARKKAEESKPLSEIEKLQREIARLQAKLDAKTAE